MKLIKLVSIIAFALASGFAFAAAPGNIAVGSVEGTVVVTAADGVEKQLVAGYVIRENSRVSTGKDSTAKFILANGTVVVLKPNTTLDVSQFEQNNPAAVNGQDYSTFVTEPEATAGSLTTVRLVKGTAMFKVAKLLPGSKFTVKTSAGNIAVKGTTFYVTVSGASVSAGCIDGAIAVSPTGRATLTLTSGKSATISGTSGSLSFGRASVALTNEAKTAFAEEETKKAASSTTGTGSADAFDVTMPPASVEGPIGSDRISEVNSASSVGDGRLY
ncbi:MAG: FecR domain-containing protein [Opitutales bacterium]|nr:FecR domain-containing protein [Opitutales bacterium]